MKIFYILFLIGSFCFGAEVNNKVKPIPMTEIKYVKSLQGYSLFDISKEGFKDYLNKEKINEHLLAELYNRIDNDKSILVSAYAYDYGHQRPDLAESFYKLIKPSMGFENILRYADFLIRTGRLKEVEALIPKMDCVKNIKFSAQCNYYLGIANYLLTGNNKNLGLNLSKKKIEKAKEIYYQSK